MAITLILEVGFYFSCVQYEIKVEIYQNVHLILYRVEQDGCQIQYGRHFTYKFAVKWRIYRYLEEICSVFC